MAEISSYHAYVAAGRPVALLMAAYARSWPVGSEGWDEYGWADVELSFAVTDEPERAWECICHALGDPECHPHLGVLAAGPLENLLSLHGDAVIDRVEAQAAADPLFAWTLGGVWRFQMSDEIWARVQLAWDRRGWDGEQRPDGAPPIPPQDLLR